MMNHSESIAFNAPPSVNTPTSPNTNVVTTPTYDTNNTTNLSFQYQGRIPVWNPTVSQAITSAELGNDLTIGDTTWVKGMTVTYVNIDASSYTVTLNGTIIDGGGSYKHAGTTLGIFKRSDQQQAVHATRSHAGLKEAKFHAAASVNTPTSPNTNAVTTPTYDTNNTTYLSFQYQGRIPMWNPTVSQAITSAELGNDLTIGDTTWTKGLTATYNNIDKSLYTVTLSGVIIDGGGIYRHAGTTLGIFKRTDSGAM